MNRFALPLLLAGTFLVTVPALAQTKKKANDGWGSSDGWGTPAPAPKKAAAAPKKAAAAPAAADVPMEAPAAEPVAAPAADAVSSQAGFGGGGMSAAGTSNQPGGSVVAPGFTAAPSHRVTTDYRGRPLAPYIKRNVRRPDPVVAAPMPEPEPEPVAAAPEPAAAPVAASASATKASGGTTATKKAAAPAAKKAAPAKKKDDGWGSGGSGW
ncbi:hypothetical protein [Hymenobacter sp. APR13]|uniref:hypothetical protein n=1 Tax=Hymenobacter sp. APR13 TaxID=1356852 RepID=UPI0012E018F7|nr:hypothetical protein [Hymenobacter sp. APR13]